MELFLTISVWVVVAAMSLVSAGHALLHKKDPRSASGWVAVCIILPVAGPFLYWTIGVNRIRRRAMIWIETGKRRRGWASFPERNPDEAAGELPPWGACMSDLRRLGDRVTRFPLLPGNRIVPLHNGEGAYPSMLAAIEAATSSIHLSTYIFDGDRTGRAFTDALAAAAERGVRVRVIIDALGEKYSRCTARKLLKGSKVRVERFLPLRRGAYVNLRNHRKILLTDGRIAFTGGMNIGSRHLVQERLVTAPVADLHFRVEGPVVGDLQRIFLGDWHFVTGEVLLDPELFPALSQRGTSFARGVSDGPDKEFRRLNLLITGALACARSQVLIMTPYFIPDRPLVSALATTAMRGVEVILLLPEKNNLFFIHWATRAYLWEILQLGIQVYYQPAPFVHTKLMLVDGTWSLLGSANLDPRSLRLNFELDLEVYDPHLGAELREDFVRTLERSRPVTAAEMDERPLSVKLRDGAAKLFSPYL